MRTLINTFILFFSTLAIAQESSSGVMQLPYAASDYLRLPGMATVDLRKAMDHKNEESVEGSPYLFKSWANNSKIYSNRKVYNFTLFNYNVYAERFEAKVSEDSVFIINPKGVDKVLVRNRVFSRYLDPDYQRNSYFEEIIGGKDFLLLRKYYTKIKAAFINPLTKEQEGPQELIQNENFYVVKGQNTPLEKIKFKKSSVLNIIGGNHVKEVQSYVKKNKLKYNQVDDVIRILTYYNTL